jgi:16S rRNA (cytosine1402-N4)-methyltransferase
MDIGVSSHQLDAPERGFSFRFDAPNDMRMDTRRGRTAAEFLEQANRQELEKAVRDYGEEPRWFRIVNAIESARGSGRLSRTASFAHLVAEAAPPPPGPRGPHPATKTFQGVRIAINDELGALSEALPKAFAKLKQGGVLAVISFHSLEDRLVKRYMNGVSGRPLDREDNRTQDERVKLAELLTRKAVQPSAEEQSRNPRSRSARLRAVRRIAP